MGLNAVDHFQNLELVKMMVQNSYANDVKMYSICDQARQETLNFMKLTNDQEINEQSVNTTPTWNQESASIAIEISK